MSGYLNIIESKYPEVAHMIPPLPDGWARNWYACNCGLINRHDYIPYGAMMPNNCSGCGESWRNAESLQEDQAMKRIHAINVGLRATV